MSSRTGIARKQVSVCARIGSSTVFFIMMLTEGMFLTCPGSVAVDIRFLVSLGNHVGPAFLRPTCLSRDAHPATE